MFQGDAVTLDIAWRLRGVGAPANFQLHHEITLSCYLTLEVIKLCKTGFSTIAVKKASAV